MVEEKSSQPPAEVSKEIQEGQDVKMEVKKEEPKDKRVWISRKRLEDLSKKADETQFYLDHLQRLQAEFENFRKRNIKEREELRRVIIEDFILELLGVLDNFDRAMETMGKTQNIENLQSGLAMIYRQFLDCLSRRGVSELNALGQPFDPTRHDAIAHEESKDVPPHQVISQLTKGYMLHGKVIRPCRVTVSKEPTPPAPSASETKNT